MGGEGKFQAEARAGRDRELGSPGNVKLVQPGRTRDCFRRQDPEMRLTVLCIVIPKNSNSFGVGGCVIVIICPVSASLTSNVCISSGMQPRHSGWPKPATYVYSSCCWQGGWWGGERGEETRELRAFVLF